MKDFVLATVSLNTDNFLNVSVLIEFLNFLVTMMKGKCCYFFLGEVLKNVLQAAKKKRKKILSIPWLMCDCHFCVSRIILLLIPLSAIPGTV